MEYLLLEFFCCHGMHVVGYDAKALALSITNGIIVWHLLWTYIWLKALLFKDDIFLVTCYSSFVLATAPYVISCYVCFTGFYYPPIRDVCKNLPNWSSHYSVAPFSAEQLIWSSLTQSPSFYGMSISKSLYSKTSFHYFIIQAFLPSHDARNGMWLHEFYYIG